MCSAECEAVEDVNVDCEQCGKRVHSFWQDIVGKLLTISDCLVHLLTRFMSILTPLGDTTQFLLSETKMGTDFDHGR